MYPIRNKTEAVILAAVKEQWLVNDPGTRFHYSNLGSVLGRALGHAGQSYESLVYSRIHSRWDDNQHI